MTVRVRLAYCAITLLLFSCGRTLCAGSATSADAPGPSADEFQLYSLAKQAAGSLYSSLLSFVCKERIERFRSGPDTAAPRAIDTLTSNVSFEDGSEHYTEIEQNGKHRSHMSDVPGAWSEGEFGTLIRQTRDLLTSQQVSFWRYEDVDGVAAGLYTFEVSEAQSPWDLKVGSRHFRVPFRTEVWVSRATGQVLKIARASTSEPAGTGISEIHWTVTLAPTMLNGKEWLLPKAGEYAVTYHDTDQKHWNLLSFSDYHRYETEVTIHFADAK